MKRFLKRLSLLASALALAGLAFAWSGLFNIAASSGHLPGVGWFLHFVMRQSVETHARAITAPPLDDPALVQRAAGHYDQVCAFCHGRPGERRAPSATSMTPPPPAMVPALEGWRSRELFWIVKHGVKYTGMPAWPTLERDDEVWAMVAFLRRLPDMSPEAYRQLALGEGDGSKDPAELCATADIAAAPDEKVLEHCARCHGAEGAGRGVGAVPRLDGQSAAYLRRTLQDFAKENRPSGIMQTAVVGLAPETLDTLAACYAAIGPGEASGEADEAPADGLIDRGREIAMQGVPKDKVGACAACHRLDAAVAVNPNFPRIAGQPRWYLEAQLTLFRDGARHSEGFSELMGALAHNLTSAEIEATAAFYASLPWQQPQAPEASTLKTGNSGN